MGRSQTRRLDTLPMSPYSPNVQGPAANRLTIGVLAAMCLILLVLLGAAYRGEFRAEHPADRECAAPKETAGMTPRHSGPTS